MGTGLALDMDVGGCIKWFAFAHEPHQGFSWVVILEKGTCISPRRPLQDGLHIRLDPDRNREIGDQRPGFRIGHRAAARGEHMGRAFEQTLDDPGFSLPEALLAMGGEQIGNAHPGGFLDFLIRVEKGQAEPRRQTASHGGFADAHHADQHHRPFADEVGVFTSLPHEG